MDNLKGSENHWYGGGAPAGAPGGAPGPAGAPGPGSAPASFGESWAADTHKEEFGNEYVAYTRRSLKTPDAFRDKKWLKEMRESPGDFDLDRDYTRDKRLRTMNSGAYTHEIGGYGPMTEEEKEDPRPPWSGSPLTTVAVS